MAHRRWLLIVAMLALFGLAACSAAVPRLEGALRDAVSGGVVADAQVHIADLVIPADSEGRFEVELPLGEHQARVVADGYVETLLLVMLSDEARQQSLEVALQPRILQGRVTLADTGEPLTQGQVQFGEQTQPLGDDGAFGLHARTLHDLTVTCEGCLSTTMSADQVRAAFAPDGALRAPLAIQVAPRLLDGVVREPDGAPVHGAQVRLGERATSTNEEGRFRLRLVQEGGSLQVSSPAHRPLDPAPYTGQPSLEMTLEPWEAVVQALDEISGRPLVGVLVASGAAEATTDAEGRAVVRATPGSELTLSAEGYRAATALYEGTAEPITVTLQGTRIVGLLHNQEDGAPVANALVQVYRQGRDEPELLRTDAEGGFDIPDAQDVTRLFIKAPGYHRVDLPLTQMGRLEIPLERFDARGIYVGLALLSLPDRIYALLDMIQASGHLNAVVLDVKGDWAVTSWESDVPLARELGTTVPGLMPIEEVLEACRERGIYTIGRIVIFKDRLLARGKPEWAIKTQSGALYQDNEGQNWVDPFRREVWDYNIALMLEAVDKGFDEVQFDYVRFPDTGSPSNRVYSQEATFESRTAAIGGFVEAAYRAIEPTPAFLSADIFGLTPWVDPSRDMGIGQRVDDIAPHMDYISPMVYPTTFNRAALQSIGISDTWLAPYETVYHSVLRAIRRTDTLVRPWIQHYSWGVPYGIEEFLLQRRAVEDAGGHGWLYWNAGAKYREEIMGPDPYHLLSRIPEPPTPAPPE